MFIVGLRRSARLAHNKEFAGSNPPSNSQTQISHSDPRARCLRPWVVPHHPDRAPPGSRRRSAAAAHRQRGRAVRARAAGRHVPSGADGGDGALPADRPRPPLHPARGAGERPVGAADPAHRIDPAPGGLIFFTTQWSVETTRQCPLWVCAAQRRRFPVCGNR
jgi:hypothetical protein